MFTIAGATEQIWVTDGTAGGTTLLADTKLNPARDEGFLHTSNGVAYFTAFNPGTGSQLWRSDGTAAGTAMISIIDPAGGSMQWLGGAASGGYFLAADPINGAELWRTDGTAAGTALVKDITPGIASTAITSAIQFGSRTALVVDTAAYGSEIWLTDGTASGTALLQDIVPGATGSSPSDLVVVGSQLFFVADDSSGGRELWVSDGTSAGTVRFADRVPSMVGSDPSELTAVGGILYFSASDIDGTRLWRSDGTAGGTWALYDATNIESGPYNPTGLFGVGDRLYFQGFDSAGGDELWTTDGTVAGTVRVKDINQGMASADPRVLCANGSLVYFAASDGVSGSELWRTDGTEGGTVLIKDVQPGAGGSTPENFFVASNGLMLFVANDGSTGRELWTTDGTSLGTIRLKDITGGTDSSSPSAAVQDASAFYFAATDERGRELWRSNGKGGGTQLIKDINPGTDSSDPSDLAWLGSRLFFAADDGLNGRELWATDGTETGTLMVADINPLGGSADPAFMTQVNGVLYFTASDGLNGEELWRSDGTAAGTWLVKDLASGTSSSSPASLVGAGGILYFTASDASGGLELWRSDGTGAGTYRVRDINPGTESANPKNLTALGGLLFFNANNGSSGEELWRSDGTEAGTYQLKDIAPGSPWSSPSSLTAAGGVLYFAANDGVAGAELWRSDGTAAGTVLVADINSSEGYSTPTELTYWNGVLYFAATDSLTGREVWRSDGTAAGTYRLLDLNAGPDDADPSGFTVAGTNLYFSADDGAVGRELWVTDGTSGGTTRVADFNAGTGGANPTALTPFGSALYIVADDGLQGAEWLRVGEAPRITVTGSANLSSLGYIQFSTNLSAFRAGAADSPLVRPAYPDTRQYIDITNSGGDVLTISRIAVNAPDVTLIPAVGDTATSFQLNAGQTQRFLLAFRPTTPTAGNTVPRNFSMDDGLVITSDAADSGTYKVALKGASTFNSDISYDGKVNLSELGVLNANFGRTTTSANWDPTADVNGDGKVNLSDLGPLNAEYGKQIASGLPTSGGVSADSDPVTNNTLPSNLLNAAGGQLLSSSQAGMDAASTVWDLIGEGGGRGPLYNWHYYSAAYGQKVQVRGQYITGPYMPVPNSLGGTIGVATGSGTNSYRVNAGDAQVDLTTFVSDGGTFAVGGVIDNLNDYDDSAHFSVYVQRLANLKPTVPQLMSDGSISYGYQVFGTADVEFRGGSEIELWYAQGDTRLKKLFGQNFDNPTPGDAVPYTVSADHIRANPPPPGTTHLVAIADRLNLAAEYNETDNQVSIPLPNMVATAPRIESGKLKIGYRVERTPPPPSPYNVRLYWASGTTWSTHLGNEVFMYPIDTAATGDEKVVEVPTDKLQNPPAGAKYLLTVVDPFGVAPESDESDNVAAMLAPNLRALAPQIDSSGRLLMRYAVDGSQLLLLPADSITAQLWWSADGKSKLGGEPIRSARMVLGTSGTQPVPISKADLADAPAGARYLLTLVDPLDGAMEATATDNSVASRIGDVSVSRFAWDGSGGLRFTLTTKNIDDFWSKKKKIPVRMYWVHDDGSGDWRNNILSTAATVSALPGKIEVEAKKIKPPPSSAANALVIVADPNNVIPDLNADNNFKVIPLPFVPAYMSDAPGAATTPERVSLWVRKYEKTIRSQANRFGIDSRAIAGAIAYQAIYDTAAHPLLPGDGNSNRYALLVGASDYRADPNNKYDVLGDLIDGWGNLSIGSDLANMQSIVSQWSFNAIDVIEQPGSTISAMSLDSAISGAASVVDGDDVFLFYYTGHGSWGPDLGRGVDGSESLHLPSGDDYTDSHLASLLSSCLPKSTLKIVIVDACHAGGFVEELSSIPNTLVLAAAAANQVAVALTATQQSIFTTALGNAVLGKQGDHNGDGLVTLREAFDYAATWVPLQKDIDPRVRIGGTSVIIPEAPQQPVIGPSWRDFVPGVVLQPALQGPARLPAAAGIVWDVFNGLPTSEVEWPATAVPEIFRLPTKSPTERAAYLSTPQGAIEYTAAILNGYALRADGKVKARSGSSLRSDPATLVSVLYDHPERRSINEFGQFVARLVAAGAAAITLDASDAAGQWVAAYSGPPGKVNRSKYIDDMIVQGAPKSRKVPHPPKTTVTVSRRTAVQLTISNAVADDGSIFQLDGAFGTSGTVSVSGDVLTYLPGANFSGRDTFTYTMTDGEETLGVGEIEIIASAPAAPVWVDTERWSTAADLKWTHDSTTAISYQVQYRNSGTSSWKVLGTVPVAANQPPQTSFLFQSRGVLVPDTTYDFRIVAVGDFGCTASTVNDSVKMGPPIPGNLRATVHSTSMHLYWDFTSGSQEGFIIRRQGPGDTSMQELIRVGPDVRDYIDSPLLADNTRYVYDVRSYRGGIRSEPSVALEVVTQSAEPTNLHVDEIWSTQANLSWTDNSKTEQFYRIESSLDGDHWTAMIDLPANSTSWNMPAGTLAPETTYRFRARSLDAQGLSDPAASGPVTTGPRIPVNVRANVGSTEVHLYWDFTSGSQEGFIIRRQGPGDTSMQELIRVGPDVRDYEDKTVVADNARYLYDVRSYRGGVRSEPSNAIEIITKSALPSSLHVDEIWSTQANLSWTDNSRTETGYQLEYSTDGSHWSVLVTFGANVSSWNMPAGTLVPETTYWFQIRSVDGQGVSSANSTGPVTTGPRIPGNLTADVRSTVVHLYWANTATGVTEFIVMRGASAQSMGEIARVAGTQLDYLDETVQPGTTYVYAVRSVRGSVRSEPSVPLTVTTASSATNVTPTVLSDARVRIDWAYTGKTPIWFDVWIKVLGDGSDWVSYLPHPGPGDRSLTLTGLYANTDYDARIRVVYDGGQVSDWTNMPSFHTTAYTAPMSVTTSVVDQTQAWINWGYGGSGTVFQIEVTGNGTTSYYYPAIGERAFPLGSLKADTDYSVRIRAVYPGNQLSSWSNTSSFRTASYTAVGSATAISTGPNSNKLTWAFNGSGHVRFQVIRRMVTVPVQSWQYLADQPAGVRSCFDTGLSVNNDYEYLVRAIYPGEQVSDWSPTTTARTAYTPPTNASAVALDATRALITWSYPDVNLALNRPAEASSTYDSRPASNAVDGNMQNEWVATTFGTPTEPQWLQVDLGSVFAIGFIRVIGASTVQSLGLTNDYRIHVSSDGVNWSQVAAGVTTDTYDPEDVHNIGSVSARFVRYWVVGGSNWAHLRELQVFGPAATGPGLGFFQVNVQGGGSSWWVPQPDPMPWERSIVVTGLKANTEYDARVRSVYPNGQVSIWANMANFWTAAAAAAVPDDSTAFLAAAATLPEDTATADLTATTQPLAWSIPALTQPLQTETPLAAIAPQSDSLPDDEGETSTSILGKTDRKPMFSSQRVIPAKLPQRSAPGSGLAVLNRPRHNMITRMR